jgi:hypothetical protein
LIGVNVAGHGAGQLKGVMDKEKLNWRSFADPGPLGQGAIATQWNLAATPTLYVLDAQDVIRHKWVGSPGEKALDALDRLLKGAGGNGKNSTPRRSTGRGEPREGKGAGTLLLCSGEE